MDDETYEMIERAVCNNKRRFKRKKYAKEAIKAAKRKGRIFRYYRCPWCKGFHLTSSKKRKD